MRILNNRKISLVVFGLTGTVVDFGGKAPAGAFCELFRRRGIDAADAEAGLPARKCKRDHIAEMLAKPSIALQWRQRHGRDWTGDDVDALFDEFLPLQVDALPRYDRAIPGAAEALEKLRRNGVKTAAATGYNREMTSTLVGALAPQGVVFDYVCCAADVPAGRPRPWMIHRCMEALDIFPPSRVVAVGDTLADIRSGVNAGVWTVGVTTTGAMLGMSPEQFKRLDAEEAAFLHETAAETMREAGADMELESVAGLPRAIEAIEHDLSQNKLPGSRHSRRREPVLNWFLENSAAVPASVSLR